MLTSFGISAIVFTLSRSLPMTISSFLSGILVDFDHLLDYFREQGLKFNIRDFFTHYCQTGFLRIYLFFHSYEIVFLLAIAIPLIPKKAVPLGIMIGLLQHLLCDQFSNSTRPLTYFFFFRLRHNFVTRQIFNPAPLECREKQEKEGIREDDS